MDDDNPHGHTSGNRQRVHTRSKRVFASLANGWFLLLILAATLFLFAFSFLPSAQSVDAKERCFKNDPKTVWAYYGQSNDATKEARLDKAPPVQLALVPEQDTTLLFGRTQAVRAFDIDYKLSLQGAATGTKGQGVQTLSQRFGQGAPLQVDILQFRRSDGAALDNELIEARARVIGDRVRVTICVDRREAHALGGPGNYRGTVSIIDPRVTRVDLPLDLDAAYPGWARVLSLVGLALLAGSWVTWVVKEQKADTSRFQPGHLGGLVNHRYRHHLPGRWGGSSGHRSYDQVSQ